MKMVSNAKSLLVALLFFGTTSSVLAGTHPGSDHYGLATPQGAAPVAKSDDRTEAMSRAAKPVTAKEKAWSVPPQLSLVPSALVCHHGITDSTMVWIKLTTPGGGLIYINLEQVISIRSDTQVLGANSQLDLVSGKFQGVLENVEQVMKLITAAAAARVNGECA
jgi:hypothetical protein